VKRLVLDHHERLDGRGYPRGLGAGDLDLETRILALCDVYDALVSPRVYRPAWTVEEALALIRNEAGTAFDPQCVDALFEILGQNVAAFPARPATDRLASTGWNSLRRSKPASYVPKAGLTTWRAHPKPASSSPTQATCRPADQHGCGAGTFPAREAPMHRYRSRQPLAPDLSMERCRTRRARRG
jgi:hypothetical protein